MLTQKTIIIALVTSIMILTSNNLYSVSTPIKNNSIKKKTVAATKNQRAKIISIQGLPTGKIRLGSKIKLVLTGTNLNRITQVQLLNNKRSAGKAILVKGSQRTTSQRTINLEVDKRAMRGTLMLKFYDGNSMIKIPKIKTLQLENKNQSSQQNLFKSITVTTEPFKFTGQRPELFKSITITTEPLKFIGQRPELFKSITITTEPFIFTGQLPELFKSITFTTEPFKFTGQRTKK